MNLKNLNSKEARKLIATNPVVVVSSINEEKETDALTVAWLSTVSFNPVLIQVSISGNRYSHKNLEKNGEFVINLIGKDQLYKIMEVGSVSFSEDEDKVEQAGFSLRESEQVQIPKLEQGIGWLECEVKDQFGAGDHTMFVGEVLKGEVKQELWENRFLAEKADIIHYLGENKFLYQGDLIEV